MLSPANIISSELKFDLPLQGLYLRSWAHISRPPIITKQNSLFSLHYQNCILGQKVFGDWLVFDHADSGIKILARFQLLGKKSPKFRGQSFARWRIYAQCFEKFANEEIWNSFCGRFLEQCCEAIQTEQAEWLNLGYAHLPETLVEQTNRIYTGLQSTISFESEKYVIRIADRRRIK